MTGGEGKDDVMSKNVTLLDYDAYFQHIPKLYGENPDMFDIARQELLRLTTKTDGFLSFDNRYDDAIACIDRIFGKNMHTILHKCYMDMENGEVPDTSGLDKPLTDELLSFVQFLGPIVLKTRKDRKDMEQMAIVTLMAFKEAVLTKDMKTARNLLLWMSKWTSYLPKEDSFRSVVQYKQREILLVDFGFNVGKEFGGRHYAVALEKSNPSSGVILVAPISSYNPGTRIHPTNIDMGIGAINPNDKSKGNFIVMNQIRYISKMRIEKVSWQSRKYVSKNVYNEIVKRLTSRITPIDK